MSPASASPPIGGFAILARSCNQTVDVPPAPKPVHHPVHHPVSAGQVRPPPPSHQPLVLPPGPPYPPQYAALGGVPTPIPDVPISAVFLALFLVAAIAHMRIFRSNLAKSHRFVFSAATAAFCVIRVASTSLRISWAYNEQNIRLAIAAQIFVAAGVVILYITNLFFTQRLLFARHPGSAFRILVLRPAVLATILTIIAVIVVVVQSFYTLDPNTHRIDRDVQLYALTYLTAMAFLPIPTIFFMMLVPRGQGHVTKVPSGRFRTNSLVVLLASVLLTFGAAWRCGITWRTPVPITESPWYYQKACFYVANFMVEFLVVILYLVFRVDRRFFVPAPGQEAPAEPALHTPAPVGHKATGSGYSSPGSSDEESLKEEKQPLFVQLVWKWIQKPGNITSGTNLYYKRNMDARRQQSLRGSNETGHGLPWG